MPSHAPRQVRTRRRARLGNTGCSKAGLNGIPMNLIKQVRCQTKRMPVSRLEKATSSGQAPGSTGGGGGAGGIGSIAVAAREVRNC